MKSIAIGNVAVYLLDLFFQQLCFQHAVLLLPRNRFRTSLAAGYLSLCAIQPRIRDGRHASLLASVFFFLLTTFFYYWIGTTLERQWGTARFTVFYALGFFFNVVLGLVTGTSVTMYYINMSMFFLCDLVSGHAGASVWTDPAEGKVAGNGSMMPPFLRMTSVYLFSGLGILALLPILAILNYFIFFWEDLTNLLRRNRDRIAHRTSPQAINLKKAQKDVQQRKGYLHKCAVCGITDADDPNMEFRYCSKCNGYYCYCINHINNHTHVQ